MRSASELDSWMARRRGAARSSDLLAGGFTVHGIRKAVDEGRLRRVRRSWLVSPQCDDRRARAIEAGGLITCVTAAELHDLWTPDAGEIHVAVAPTASRINSAGLRLHWSRGPVATPRSALDDHPLNVLYHVARCLARAEALAVWESALRLKAVDAAFLGEINWGCDRARELAEVSSSLSDSGLESTFVALMHSVGITLRQQVWIDGHPVDALIGDRLAVQIDGFAHHSNARDRRRDIRADARLALRGYTVLRFDYQQVLFEPEYVIDTVLTALAQGLHLAR